MKMRVEVLSPLGKVNFDHFSSYSFKSHQKGVLICCQWRIHQFKSLTFTTFIKTRNFLLEN